MAAPFATADDVAARWRPLTADEDSVATTLCLDASNLLRARFPGIDAQIGQQLDQDVVIAVVAGIVKRAMLGGGDGVASQSDSVGPYGQNRTFANPLGNVFLTQADITMIIGYRPAGQTVQYANTTCHRENEGPGFVYGPIL